MAHIGILELEFALHGCGSLKDKRHVVRSLVDRLRHRFEVSAAEIDYQDVWDRTKVGVALISAEHTAVQRLLEQLIDYAEATTEAELVGIHTEIL